MGVKPVQSVFKILTLGTAYPSKFNEVYSLGESKLLRERFSVAPEGFRSTVQLVFQCNLGF